MTRGRSAREFGAHRVEHITKRVNALSWHEAIHEWKGSRHAARKGLIARRCREGVHPQDPMRDTRQSRHLLCDPVGITAVDAIGEDDDSRAARDPFDPEA